MSADLNVQIDSEDLHNYVDAVHRYWMKNFGRYPDGEDSMTIICVIAALQEYHELHCPLVPAQPPKPPRRSGPRRIAPTRTR